MFIPIKINLNELIEEFGLNENQIKFLGIELTNRISDKYFAAIKQKVNTTLKATRGIYLDNLRIEDIDLLTKEITLSGWLPNAIESGINSFDMKPGFMKAKNIKISVKNNWYSTIPFFWSSSGSEKSKKIPKNINQIINNQTFIKPLKESQIPESQRLHQIKKIAQGINSSNTFNTQDIYQHKNSIFAGIQKIDNGAISFRRVGAVSNPNSFWHPGITKKDFFGKALNEISSEIPILTDKIIDSYLSAQGY